MEYMWECQLDGKCPKRELKNMFESQSIFYNANEYQRLVFTGFSRYSSFDDYVIYSLAFIHSLLNK